MVIESTDTYSCTANDFSNKRLYYLQFIWRFITPPFWTYFMQNAFESNSNPISNNRKKKRKKWREKKNCANWYLSFVSIFSTTSRSLGFIVKSRINSKENRKLTCFNEFSNLDDCIDFPILSMTQRMIIIWFLKFCSLFLLPFCDRWMATEHCVYIVHDIFKCLKLFSASMCKRIHNRTMHKQMKTVHQKLASFVFSSDCLKSNICWKVIRKSINLSEIILSTDLSFNLEIFVEMNTLSFLAWFIQSKWIVHCSLDTLESSLKRMKNETRWPQV